jgi:hypothetical protein
MRVNCLFGLQIRGAICENKQRFFNFFDEIPFMPFNLCSPRSVPERNSLWWVTEHTEYASADSKFKELVCSNKPSRDLFLKYKHQVINLKMRCLEPPMIHNPLLVTIEFSIVEDYIRVCRYLSAAMSPEQLERCFNLTLHLPKNEFTLLHYMVQHRALLSAYERAILRVPAGLITYFETSLGCEVNKLLAISVDERDFDFEPLVRDKFSEIELIVSRFDLLACRMKQLDGVIIELSKIKNAVEKCNEECNDDKHKDTLPGFIREDVLLGFIRDIYTWYNEICSLAPTPNNYYESCIKSVEWLEKLCCTVYDVTAITITHIDFVFYNYHPELYYSELHPKLHPESHPELDGPKLRDLVWQRQCEVDEEINDCWEIFRDVMLRFKEVSSDDESIEETLVADPQSPKEPKAPEEHLANDR